MIFLRAIKLKEKRARPTDYPFTLPIVQNLTKIEFKANVTFFVGENGCGKSTLLEAIAAGMKSIAVGSADIQADSTLLAARELSKHLTFIRNQPPKRGFFFRAEDIFGFTKQITDEMARLQEMAADFKESLQGYGQQLAMGAAQGQQQALAAKYGADPDAKSHGESFLEIFQARLVPEGLYLLDEPETPLSPLRQLAFLAILKKMVAQDCQFIIATHSPIVMAFPEALILNFDGEEIKPISYDEVAHVKLTRSFLEYPDIFLKQL